MKNDDEISKKIEQYRELAAENKNIDLTALAMSAMGEVRQDEIDARKRRRAYLISVVIPPLGALYFLKYFWSGKADGKRVALTCLALTALSILISTLIVGMMYSSSGITESQIQDVNIDDLKSLIL